MRLAITPHDIEDVLEHRAAQRIENLVALLAADQLRLARRTAKCCDKLACFQAQPLSQFPGRKLAIAKLLQDGNPGRMGQSLEDLGLEAADGFLHSFSIFGILRIY